MCIACGVMMMSVARQLQHHRKHQSAWRVIAASPLIMASSALLAASIIVSAATAARHHGGSGGSVAASASAWRCGMASAWRHQTSTAKGENQHQHEKKKKRSGIVVKRRHGGVTSWHAWRENKHRIEACGMASACLWRNDVATRSALNMAAWHRVWRKRIVAWRSSA